ncbi:oxygen sensor protein DosP [mine drainage metagenome]|uniref:Oxygen sensor protein DosP n=1 Tax=mine drainage metagenome TaxID=410659 RepID=A0A1J5PQH8_9ZZZZ
MREFERGLQRRWEQIWQRCKAKNLNVLPEDQAQVYRQQIFMGGLVMFAQPVVDLRTGTVRSVEALARLRMPDGTIVAPGSFLPLLGYAELDHVFRQGLDQALKWLITWNAQELALDVSINLSPSTLFNPDCPAWVDGALRHHGLAPHRLSIELLETETVDSTTQRESIEQLSHLGVRLAMDDLGSGYSSLERLSTLPFDVIKIDQSLVATMYKSPIYVLSFVGALIQLGRDLEREVVVEGLEDEAMVEAVAILGAPFGQGYGLSRPMPPDAVPEWVRGFRLPIQSGHTRTALGALAYHWQFTHLGDPHHPVTDLERCPMTQFLQEHAPQDNDAAKWHARVHSETGDEEASRLLTQWLLRKICL